MNAAADEQSRRPRWSLQTRLIVTVVSFVAVIFVAVGLAIGTTVRGIIEENLDTQIRISTNQIHVLPGDTAYDTLSRGRQQSGTLLVMQTFGDPTGAYVDSDLDVVELTPDEVSDVIAAVDQPGPQLQTVTLPGLGDYRVLQESYAGGASVVLGMSATALTSTIARMVGTVALVTLAGLLVLAIVIALVIRHSLRPLRNVADTATRVAAIPLAAGDVSIEERVPAAEADDRTEIGRVGAALNTLLDHVDTSLQARQRNEERMREFVADASHELRTPLASIRGYSELSLRALAQGDAELAAATTSESLERIQAQSLRMSALVEDLLLLARLDEGTELVYGAVDLSRLAVDAVSDARAAGLEHEWVLDVTEDPVIVAGDMSRLHQVAANLLANARVHTPAGTTVTTGVRVDGATAVLRVHDDGPGIDPAVAESLFERFARADTSRARKTGGTGLGLSIAKAIVTAHDGVLSVESEPGSTTFEVRLPARPASPRQ